MSHPEPHIIEHDVRLALSEDIQTGDVTASLIPKSRSANARVICREQAVLCGQHWFDQAMHQLDPELQIRWHASDGDVLQPGQTLCEVSGNARAILTAERTALNFVQLLSAVATRTRQHCDLIRHTSAVILDTRKTIPGLRLAQKYAVRCGGGQNHRIGLFDAFLIKENHILSAGSIEQAVEAARALRADLLIEVEVESLEQMNQAIQAGAQRIMLDNFDLEQTREAVRINAGRVALEASGNLDLDRLVEVAETGVDYLSIGGLTKHIQAVDLSMRFEMT